MSEGKVDPAKAGNVLLAVTIAILDGPDKGQKRECEVRKGDDPTSISQRFMKQFGVSTHGNAHTAALSGHTGGGVRGGGKGWLYRVLYVSIV
jgi:hypothetical protein